MLMPGGGPDVWGCGCSSRYVSGSKMKVQVIVSGVTPVRSTKLQ
ncbi:hypothetical protein WMW72_21585 [Paenibacillus filicis]|uniref:Uncharacterized protein n=1 Tax=Paenibacillus filicis TaxID=669464 RepID=A0ABU9DNQ6_9BACL